MLFSRQLPLADLIRVCHVGRLSLSAGLTLRDVFRQLADKGPIRLRGVAARIGARLKEGEDLQTALETEPGVFPPLFLSMVAVGEQTGHLPEILEELERYYQLQQKSWREIRTRGMLPVVQFVLALGILAVVIFVLGLVAQSRGTEAQGVFGFRGTGGAIKFLLLCAAGFATIFGGYLFVTRVLKRQEQMDMLLLRLPGVGGCIEAFAVARFALALQLTLDTSLPTARAVRLALQATGNGAYLNRAKAITEAIGDGEDLAVALGRGQIFPADFLSMAAVGEEGGRVVEIMRHQAAHYHEEAVRRLKALVGRLTMLIWLVYAGFMLFAILSLAGFYLRALGG
jgi:type IV pilus assembly protein PilC